MSTEMLLTGMPEVFENESSFVRHKIVIGNVRAAIGTNGWHAGVRAGFRNIINVRMSTEVPK